MSAQFPLAPRWANELLIQIASLHRKVDSLMAIDTSVIARILAGAASLVEQAQAAATREIALNAKIDELQSQLGTATDALDDANEAIAADTAADADANAQLVAAANAMEELLTGPETPVVETPTPADAPAVISGNQEPVVVSEEPAANDGFSA